MATHGATGLPPKVPIAGAPRRATSHNSYVPGTIAPLPGARRATSSASSTSVGSNDSRNELRLSLSKRQLLLTHSEQKFLEQLIVHGTEEEIEVAHHNLMDETIFGKTSEEEDEKERIADAWLSGGPSATRAGPWGEDSSNGTTQQHPSYSRQSQSSLKSSFNESISSTAFKNEAQEEGSGRDTDSQRRREELLRQRRNENQVFDHIWQAHESGLAVTQHSSRRSLKTNFFRFSSMTNAKQRNASQIFRQRVRVNTVSTSSQQNLLLTTPPTKSQGSAAFMNDNKSDNFRRRPIVPVSLESPVNSTTLSGFQSPLQSGGHKPNLRRMCSDNHLGPAKLHRMLSDSSRKSVTFDVPHIAEEQPPKRSLLRSSWSGTRRPLKRGISIGSVPSIHKAHSIRSNSVVSYGSQRSGFSFPVIPHAQAMRSQSILSSEGRDPSEAEGSIREEKKVDDLWPRVPSVVQTDNTAKFFQQKQLVAHGDHDGDPLANDGMDSSDYFNLDPGLLSDDDSKFEPVGAHGNVMISDSRDFRRPVLMRDVSFGEGIEVADLTEQILSTPTHMSPVHKSMSGAEFDFGAEDDSVLIQTAYSFDETMSFRRMNSIFRRPLQRSLSDEAAAGLFLGPATIKDTYNIDGESWQMEDEEDDMMDYYDPWMVLQDEYENGYGGAGTLPFQIIGTNADDKSAQPHVLSPPLMESLQQFFPFAKTGENLWLKYSMVRDGASMHTFLKHARNAKSSILAIETTEGEVFGAFTSECWRKNWNYFGSGEAFLWRMGHSRGEKARSIIDQASRESEIQVFPYTGENTCVQLCTPDRLAVGGGTGKGRDIDLGGDVAPPPPLYGNKNEFKEHDWGFGLSIQGNMLQGTSSPCLTFGSPSLSKLHPHGSLFEILNLELWSLTPCYTLEEAEKLELGKLFLEKSYSRD